MRTILVVTASPASLAHALMAAEALREQGSRDGHRVLVDIRGAPDATPLTEADIAAADAVLVAADTEVEASPFAGKPVHRTTTAKAIRDPEAALRAAFGDAPRVSAAPASSAPATVYSATRAENSAPPAGKKLVAVTACPTGIAHTFMAAEALRKQAAAMGHTLAVETQGSVGAKNVLTPTQIREADAVIIAADTAVDPARFTGKAIHTTTTGTALKKPAAVIEAALAAHTAHTAHTAQAAQAAHAAHAFTARGTSGGSATATPLVAFAPGAPEDAAPLPSATSPLPSATSPLPSPLLPSPPRPGPYKHLLTGVSYMLPLVVAGGLLVALSFLWGVDGAAQPGTLPAALMQVGSGAALALMVPVLSGFIAYSIADRPGLAPGLVGGMLAAQQGAGFLGGIASGFIAGYAARWLRDAIRLPQSFEGLKPVLLIPLLGTLITGLIMVYVVGAPARAVMDHLTGWLEALSGTNAVLLGLLLGGMMAIDMGGPINKAAYAFGVGLIGAGTLMPMAAVMAAGMVPPLAIAAASRLAPRKFIADERQAASAAFVLGICFITEGAIPFAAKAPLRIIPAVTAGAALTGALSMLFGCTLRAPHGGLFVLGIPNAVGNVGAYLGAILAGTVLSALLVALVKRPAETEAPEAAPGADAS
ncbi:fructose-specific PTS transporter subunit EIIC [Chondromyces apiculatus]|uniref:protein-N(pi)-phosphohistidine--D-fructose phosphotransferase n=1 Tax=Chondromyces apiculatus DSM 436 TaxID=1192034 RepID=A0A017TAL7_9BACT|nr:PTS fructose transporter subunit EIIBC [Chondromyces apiculatus]EYF05952.1 PTS system, fructose-specific IIB component [Chondromyces apiculatus DSM 436]